MTTLLENNDIQTADIFLKSDKVAHALDTTTGVLALSRHTGELFKGVPAPPHIKSGRSVRYSLRDLEEWMAEQPRYTNTAESHLAIQSKSQTAG